MTLKCTKFNCYIINVNVITYNLISSNIFSQSKSVLQSKLNYLPSTKNSATENHSTMTNEPSRGILIKYWVPSQFNSIYEWKHSIVILIQNWFKRKGSAFGLIFHFTYFCFKKYEGAEFRKWKLIMKTLLVFFVWWY